MRRERVRAPLSDCPEGILSGGAKADFSGDDKGLQGAFGKIIIGGDTAVFSPVIEAMGMLKKDFLIAFDGEVVCWADAWQI